MADTKRFKITIRRVLIEDYEMVLENENLMAALDEARRLVASRNERSKIGKFSVIRIEETKEEKDESSNHVSQGELHSEFSTRGETNCCG